jgi:hypothetical protein
MRKIKILLVLMIFSFLLLLPFGKVYAKERNIYIGDLINLKISTQDITEKDIRDKFSDFEIVDLKEEADGYLLTVRSFQPGTTTIQLGNDELKITVKSTLEEIDRKDVFEGAKNSQKAGFSINWQYLLYLAIVIFLVTGGITLFRLRRKKRIVLTPYQQFLKQADLLLLKEDGCLVQMNSCLKEYMESSYSCKIKGKTSDEIIMELGTMPKLQTNRQALHTWFEKCDYYKFTNAVASMELKQAILEELKGIVASLEMTEEVEA